MPHMVDVSDLAALPFADADIEIPAVLATGTSSRGRVRKPTAAALEGAKQAKQAKQASAPMEASSAGKRRKKPDQADSDAVIDDSSTHSSSSSSSSSSSQTSGGSSAKKSKSAAMEVKPDPISAKDRQKFANTRNAFATCC